jgi:predicted TIM-barrel fold metal-dependent hydrolase
MVFNGLFERYPNMKVAFLEGGIGWLLMCLERFDRSHATHMEYHLRDEDMPGPQIGEAPSDYIQRQINADRLFIGCEGEEPALAYAVSLVGPKPFVFSTDFPHEVTAESCREEIQELLDNEILTDDDKSAILHENSVRLYSLKQSSHTA